MVFESKNDKEKTVIVGLGSCGVSAGGKKIYELFKEKIEVEKLPYKLDTTGCVGMCHSEVIVQVNDPEVHVYGDVSLAMAEKIIAEHLKGGKVVEEALLFNSKLGPQKKESFENQKRIVLRNAGKIEPTSIDDYIAHDGYTALKKVLKEMKPEEIIDEVFKSGLRGRGGAGFLTGQKWKLARANQADEKYIICNGDEGDPGAFMDRSVLESDPHSVLEGMTIAAYAIGANKGIIYVRAEYPMAVRHLRIAIDKAREKKFLGNNIFKSKFSFDVIIKEGAGAFVCGEETALIQSVEGKRGMPNIRPPYPAEKGLWGKPTNINNVETFANVPWIILNGSKAYSSIGTEKSAGTKVFALAGKVKFGGLVEVPMGMTLSDVIYKIGGGIQNDRPFKAVQMGGPSGGCIPASLIDIPVDYERVNATGAIMGSGGMVVMDDTSCMVDIARFFLQFTQNESCGKCTFCRVGTKRMLEILNKITQGKGTMEDLTLLEELSAKVKTSSLCGLGQTAPNPVFTTLKYFRDEYEAHIKEKKCPAKYCADLIEYSILTDKCNGCSLCAKKCPTQAISGKPKSPYTLDMSKCIKCGICINVCKFKAVEKESKGVAK